MTRTERIHTRLASAEHHGYIRGYYSHAPGDGWRRWVIESAAPTLGGRTYSTREVEAFLDGIAAVSS